MQKIPKNIDFVLNKLQAAGFKAYLVGGCVRDMLLDSIPHDYDITTSATPEEIKLLFCRTVDTGIKHGTVTVIQDGEPIEVTTFRTEAEYSDARHPDTVRFVRDLESDLARRDFTVNAIGYSPATGIIDPFGGEADIKARLLRAVGEPGLRFGEDALRILRLFRFAATLNFRIESETRSAAYKCADGLEKISRERIAEEIKKAVLGDNLNPFEAFLMGGALSFCGIKNCCSKTSLLPKQLNLRLFSFLFVTENDIKAICKSLKLSNTLTRYFCELETVLNLKRPETKIEIKGLLRRFEEEIIKDSFLYRKQVLNEDIGSAEPRLQEILENGEAYKISQLKIGGEELKNAGINPKEIGKNLERLLDSVIENPALNDQKELLKLVTK